VYGLLSKKIPAKNPAMTPLSLASIPTTQGPSPLSSTGMVLPSLGPTNDLPSKFDD
jgi:hypothetical protein